MVERVSAKERKSLSHWEFAMLVLSRKLGERIRIGDSISITVVRISGGGVRLGIEAPAEFAVIREELFQKLVAGQQDEVELPTSSMCSADGQDDGDGI